MTLTHQEKKNVLLAKESYFVNLESDNSDLKYARQNYVNRRFGKTFFSIYDEYKIVGYTLNETKTKVIRIFFNKYQRPEGDLVTETTHYPITLGMDSSYYKSDCL